MLSLTAESCELFNIPFYQFAQMKKFCPEDIPAIKADYKLHWDNWKAIIQEVAKQLGIKYYDKDIIAQIAEQSGFSAEYIEEKAELSPKKGLLAYAFAGRDITGKSVEDMVYEAQRKVILEIAEKESCVIIGRNADFILKDKDNVLNIFIHGDMPEKVARICKLYNVTEEEAEKMMADIDKRRMTNYRFYTDQKWGMAKNYTLSLNSSELGYDLCEKIIMDCKK